MAECFFLNIVPFVKLHFYKLNFGMLDRRFYE